MKHFRNASLGLALVLAGSTAVQAGNMGRLRQAVAAELPGVAVTDVRATPYPGLFEVRAGGQTFYTDAQADYFLVGDLVDARTRTDLTNGASAPRLVSFASLPLDLAFKEVRGNGKHRLAIFTDPDCPYCKQLEHNLTGVTNVTIYRFLYPITQLHPNAGVKAAAVWCAKDPLAAWQRQMLKGQAPAGPGNCKTPIARIGALGRKLGVEGTPTLIFGSGMVVPGAIPAADLRKLLDQAG